MKKDIILEQNNIKSKIYTIRGLQIMLDEDLAKLFKIKTKVLNQSIKRNIDRFPQNYMFKLSENDINNLRSQFVTSAETPSSLKIWSSLGGRRYKPIVFTEHGVAMLAGILKSKIAIEISIQIINSFITMKNFIHNNAQIFQRLDNIEYKQIEYQIKTDNTFEKIFKAIEDKNIKPSKGIFFDGQIYDAYKFASDLIKSAKESIILIDNYIDENTLTLLSKKNKSVEIQILTKTISKQLKLDIKKFNDQYNNLEIKEFKLSHDRFLIIDKKEVYHIGASLKDIGNKWFAFSKFNKNVIEILNKI
ncbi:ORF6N domain-containing protein [Candidatus Woesearchaeota archaeon]|jgi:hypothetical protein|nr:ORF6N domain-containing protein [Candidatus Woesearchaeota archaeon]MBT4595750.1 ORF6N domain-containing protein [Candidatus Woesearchaeota archaeon]MBT5741401.1 ORF6N domain-containing protein [Candidatus Woesearchaeota archaeon]MBT6505223.1 ORF6N domain-containing protein [Candidatus Woesearchaeota archaeon]MBT7296093.1 ORF6N domain-containing protein [Candidatus Woesearchaeota archaeon]